ncbi:hypothetical protein H6783_03145 [Candidatus Nomurabacteria bacterium]|nr:hypothetical protein [Candidatus Nomurabacteria bacterium]
MFRAIGFLIMLWGISFYFSSSIAALDRAATESLKTIELAAQVSQQQIKELK